METLYNNAPMLEQREKINANFKQLDESKMNLLPTAPAGAIPVFDGVGKVEDSLLSFSSDEGMPWRPTLDFGENRELFRIVGSLSSLTIGHSAQVTFLEGFQFEGRDSASVKLRNGASLDFSGGVTMLGNSLGLLVNGKNVLTADGLNIAGFLTGHGSDGTGNPDKEHRIYTDGERISFFTRGIGDPATNDEVADGYPTQSEGANLTIAHGFTGWLVGGTINTNPGFTGEFNGGLLRMANGAHLQVTGGMHNFTAGTTDHTGGMLRMQGGSLTVGGGQAEFAEGCWFRRYGSSWDEMGGGTQSIMHDWSKYISTEGGKVVLRGPGWGLTDPSQYHNHEGSAFIYGQGMSQFIMLNEPEAWESNPATARERPDYQQVPGNPFVYFVGNVRLENIGEDLYFNGRKVVTQ